MKYEDYLNSKSQPSTGEAEDRETVSKAVPESRTERARGELMPTGDELIHMGASDPEDPGVVEGLVHQAHGHVARLKNAKKMAKAQSEALEDHLRGRLKVIKARIAHATEAELASIEQQRLNIVAGLGLENFNLLNMTQNELLAIFMESTRSIEEMELPPPVAKKMFQRKEQQFDEFLDRISDALNKIESQ